MVAIAAFEFSPRLNPLSLSLSSNTFRRPVKPGVDPRRQGPGHAAGPQLGGSASQRGRRLFGSGNGELRKLFHCVGHAAQDPGREGRRRGRGRRWMRSWRMVSPWRARRESAPIPAPESGNE